MGLIQIKATRTVNFIQRQFEIKIMKITEYQNSTRYKIFDDPTYKTIKHFEFMSEVMLGKKDNFAYNFDHHKG